MNWDHVAKLMDHVHCKPVRALVGKKTIVCFLK